MFGDHSHHTGYPVGPSTGSGVRGSEVRGYPAVSHSPAHRTERSTQNLALAA